jgi:hypothetical protein
LSKPELPAAYRGLKPTCCKVGSLLLDKISLFLEENSLIRILKFPVPLRREFPCKPRSEPRESVTTSAWFARLRGKARTLQQAKREDESCSFH